MEDKVEKKTLPFKKKIDNFIQSKVFTHPTVNKTEDLRIDSSSRQLKIANLTSKVVF